MRKLPSYKTINLSKIPWKVPVASFGDAEMNLFVLLDICSIDRTQLHNRLPGGDSRVSFPCGYKRFGKSVNPEADHPERIE